MNINTKSYFKLGFFILFASLFFHASYGKGDYNTYLPDGWTILSKTIVEGSFSEVEFLLKNGADTEFKGRIIPPFVESVFNNSPLTATSPMSILNPLSLFKPLKRSTPNFYPDEYIIATPLAVATYYGKPMIARLLISYEANVSARGPWGWTPLHWITPPDRPIKKFSKVLEVADVLIENGADIHAKDIFGNSPLELAKIMLEQRKTLIEPWGNAQKIVDYLNSKSQSLQQSSD